MKLKCDKTGKIVREMTDSEKAESIIKLINDYDINSTLLLGWQIEFIEKLCRKQLNNGWIPCSERLPECEQEVWIQTERGTKTTAMYEDGKMPEEESMWNWNDIDYDYDEETDTRYIPEGWWEYKHFAPDDVYNYCVDEKVIAWQPLPEPYH